MSGESEDAAAEAFRSLEAEVAATRAKVEGVETALARRVVDYSPTLGAMQAALERLDRRLASVEAKPALVQSAEQQRLGVERMVEASLGQPVRALNDTKRSLDGLVQAAGTRFDRLGWWPVTAAALVVLVIGMGLGSLLSRGLLREVTPTGDQAAVQALGETDPWRAGLVLLNRTNPAAYAEMIGAWRQGMAGGAELKACVEAVQRTSKEQRCTITIKPAPPAGR